MRAVTVDEYGDPSVLSVDEVEEPSPAPSTNEVRVDVAAAGVNFADLVKRRGDYPDGPTPPYTPGIEVAGRVDATGAGSRFERGDRVAAYVPRGGGYAERVVARADLTFPVPSGLTLTEAAGVPVQWLTAHNALFEWGDLTAGERVLVLAAAGGVGSSAVQLAANADAEVLGVTSTAEKRAFARDLGANHAVNYDGLPAAVDELIGGAGVDLALDGVGGEAFRDALDALAPGGRVVTYGLASGEVPRVSTPRLLFRNQSVLGYHLGHAVEHERERVLGAIEEVRTALAAGDVTVEVDRTFDLGEAAAAHEYVRDRRTTGAVVLEV